RLRIIGCRADEVFDRRVEAFVRVVHQHVACLNRSKNRARSLGNGRGPKRLPFRIPQGGKRETKQLEQRGVIHFLLHFIEVQRGERKTCAKHFRDGGIGSRGELPPHQRVV